MGRAAVAAPVAGAAPKRSNQTIPGTKKTAGYRRFWSVRAGSVFPAAMAGNTPRHQNYCLSFCRALSSSRDVPEVFLVAVRIQLWRSIGGVGVFGLGDRPDQGSDVGEQGQLALVVIWPEPVLSW